MVTSFQIALNYHNLKIQNAYCYGKPENLDLFGSNFYGKQRSRIMK